MRRKLLLASVGIFLVGLALFFSRASKPTQEPGNIVPKEAWIGESIVPPRPAPDFELVDRSGVSVRLRDLKGKVVLMSFAYTNCPDVCPLLFGRFLAVQKAFEDLLGRELELVLVTVDPEVDTPERLNQVTEAMGGRWYFLTGEKGKVEQVLRDYGIYAKKEGQFVAHSAIIYLIDRNGLVRLRYEGTPPQEALISDLKGWLQK